MVRAVVLLGRAAVPPPARAHGARHQHVQPLPARPRLRRAPLRPREPRGLAPGLGDRRRRRGRSLARARRPAPVQLLAAELPGVRDPPRRHLRPAAPRDLQGAPPRLGGGRPRPRRLGGARRRARGRFVRRGRDPARRVRRRDALHGRERLRRVLRAPRRAPGRRRLRLLRDARAPARADPRRQPHGGRRGAARRGDARARARPHARRRAPLRGGPLVLRGPRAPRRERDGRRAPLRPRRRRPAGERRVAYAGGIRDLKPLRLTSSLASQLEPWTVSNDAKPPRRVEIDVDWRRLPSEVGARKEPRSINA
mmetsp:Transcript_13394/g.45868  ORF Transcript_13394/g.45868 Transcript_13394/m.45868 type:complete len:310 (+) Transcript_13394:734-1663(+)